MVDFRIGNTLQQAEQINALRKRNKLADIELEGAPIEQESRRIDLERQKAQLGFDAINSALTSKNPKQRALFEFRRLKEQGIDLNLQAIPGLMEADDDTFRQGLEEARNQLQAFIPQGEGFTLAPGAKRFQGNALIAENPAQTKGQLKSVINPQTQQPELAFITPEGPQFTGAAPTPGSSQTFSISPDGTVTFSQGAGKPPVQKPTANKLEASIIDSENALGRLQQVQNSFKPEFLTFGEKIQQFGKNFKEKLGVELTPEERTSVEEYADFQLNTIDNFNRYIKEITGAQMSEAEADRLKRGMPNEDMGPTQFRQALRTTMKNLVLLRARAKYALQNGLVEKGLPSISQSAFEDIINAEDLRFTGENPDATDEERQAHLSGIFGL